MIMQEKIFLIKFIKYKIGGKKFIKLYIYKKYLEDLELEKESIL